MTTLSSTHKRHSIRYVAGKDPCLWRHLQRLGIHSIPEYRAWCAEHGFNSRLEKSAFKRQLEIRAVEEARIQNSLAKKPTTPRDIIHEIFRGQKARLEEQQDPEIFWQPSGFVGFEQIDGSLELGNLRKWTVQELLSSTEVIAEGRAMHHCVASYISVCAEGISSLWTMRVESKDGITSQVTIEVRPSRKVIMQARGRYNRDLTGYQRVVLERWARSAGLAIGVYD
ncbi:MAG: hypothetical protein JWM11_5040 [Planctomycetaceae bacterium]|nr:hypothetical protein [Planctomycetaceae bacterium]